MKLIYLPTNRQLKVYESMAKQLLQNHSDQYIRAELPKYWRVEGYDKSWEWAQINVAKHYDVTSDKSLCSASISFEGVEVISRAEFEYHIYNPWKEGQAKQDPFTPSELYNYMAENHNVTLLGSEESVIKDIVLNDIEAIKQQAEKMGKYAGTFGNENRIEDEPTPYIETSFPRSSQAGLIEDPANGLLKDPTRPRIDYEKDSVDYLQTLAESMGYELVKKEKQAIRWESEENRYTLVDGGLHIVEKEVEEGVFIKDKEIEGLIKRYAKFNEHRI